MSTKYEFPWNKEGSGMYVSDAPPAPCEAEYHTHTIRFTPTDLDGIHSGRTRVRVQCLTCGEVLHEATTGPRTVARHHWQHALEENEWAWLPMVNQNPKLSYDYLTLTASMSQVITNAKTKALADIHRMGLSGDELVQSLGECRHAYDGLEAVLVSMISDHRKMSEALQFLKGFGE